LSFDSLTDKVGGYYTERLREHGATAKGVDWNSAESQWLRFTQLSRVLPPSGSYSVVDYGCGYGALVAYLDGLSADYDYQGFDISHEMVERARRDHGSERRRFTTSESDLAAADYTLASGIFNVKLDTEVADWKEFVLGVLDRIDRLSRRGFAFNMLTSYSDPDRMRPDLYYADPCGFFDLCKTKYSKHVALLHDYGLYEFTILVRK